MADEGPYQLCACGCGSIISQFDAQGRERRYKPGHYIKKAVAIGTAFLERAPKPHEMTDEELLTFTRRVLSL